MFVRGFYMYSFVVVCSFCKRGKDKLNGPAIGVDYQFALPEVSTLNKVVNGLCSSRTGSSFLFHEKKKRSKENSPAAFFYLLRWFSPLNKKNSLTLKQLFVFNAP